MLELIAIQSDAKIPEYIQGFLDLGMRIKSDPELSFMAGHFTYQLSRNYSLFHVSVVQ